MKVLEFPPNESFKIQVSTESRYGIKGVRERRGEPEGVVCVDGVLEFNELFEFKEALMQSKFAVFSAEMNKTFFTKLF